MWRATDQNTRYRMLPSKDVENEIITTVSPGESSVYHVHNQSDDEPTTHSKPKTGHRKLIPSRDTYWGSLTYNVLAFLLPALYGTLSKLWIAQIDSSSVVLTDVYTYISVIAEVLNEGLPRIAWLIIGNKASYTLSTRLSLSYTLIIFQTAMGLLMTVIFIAAAESFAAGFVPPEVREKSLSYVRVSAAVALTSAVQTAVASCTRAMDWPDVPLVVSSVGFAVNIVLDMLFLSTFHVKGVNPTVLAQAGIRLACDAAAAVAGLGYFVWVARRTVRQEEGSQGQKVAWWWTAGFWLMAREAVYTFSESAVRNAIYLWLVNRIIGLGADYATAWGVFNTIRWGLVMVPVQALETSALTFVGHQWGVWKKQKEGVSKPAASWKEIKRISRPALNSALVSLAVEIPICIFLSIWGMKEFAFYISNSERVADITKKMWQNIDWCYIFYALNYQFSSILLATVPRWFLYQSLWSNMLWSFPWAIVVTVMKFKEDQAWTFYSVIFGGANVFSFIVVGIVLGAWVWRLHNGMIKV
ncbi:hypothetical protein B0T20DRAFT_449231 [Sordaria brevicollis]|uniref:Uncharacterized protein n=1 Tax=Sordaria brevicollis TaxID=83679 RepID=A0AAE0NRM1_SORBR|nr:hypothetical protein B0T20DRAFT_449231 [Sordaria brevicollis]